MKGYLGEFDLAADENPYKDFTASQWAMLFIEHYGYIDGSHHKQWVIDQIARILQGTPIIVKEARWENGTKEIRFWTGEPSMAYLQWAALMGVDDEMIGIAP